MLASAYETIQSLNIFKKKFREEIFLHLYSDRKAEILFRSVVWRYIFLECE